MQVPSELVSEHIVRYVTISFLPVLLFVNKEWYQMVVDILYKNKNHSTVFARISPKINKYMADNRIKYCELLSSSIFNGFFDDLVLLYEMPLWKAYKLLHQMFTFHRKSKKYIREYKHNSMPFDVTQIAIHNKMFDVRYSTITKTSLYYDCKVFQLILHIINTYFNDPKFQTILKATLIVQLVEYFNSVYINVLLDNYDDFHEEMIDLCNDIYTKNHKSYTQHLFQFDIEKMDVNMYHWYSVLFTDDLVSNPKMIILPYKRTLSIKRLMMEGNLIASSMYSNTTEERHLKTLDFFMQTSLKFPYVTLQLTIMLMAYVNNILINDPEFFRDRVEFKKLLKHKCEHMLQDIGGMTVDYARDYYIIIARDIFTETLIYL